MTAPFNWIFGYFSPIAFWCLVKWFRCDFFIISLVDFWHIAYAAVANFNCIAVENILKFVASCFLINWRNVFELFIETDLLEAGFNDIVLHFYVFGFSDTLLNLPNGTYRPYKKPNDKLLYIDSSSNHIQQIIKQLPNSISERLPKYSFNQEIFNAAKVPFIMLIWNTPTTNQKNQKRKRET